MADPAGKEAAVLERIESFRRRRPRLLDEVVTLAHGAGGKASAALVDAVFLEAFAPLDDRADRTLPDAATLALDSGERLSFTTDSFVVAPRRFPGGSIGDLAVNGTVNDLAVSGAVPRWLSVAFVLEEGLPVEELRSIVADMAAAAATAGVAIVAGDTKVVQRGAADGCYITTTGVGVLPPGRRLGPERVQAGDAVLCSGAIGDHGMAVMLARGDLALEADIRSDTAAVGGLVERLLAAAPSTRWMRDPTRGGLGTVANELARDANLAVVLDEAALPIHPAVAGACDLLGIDPLYVANEGKFVAVVAPEEQDAALEALRSDPLGAEAVRVGEIAADPEGIVVLLTTFGGTRIVDMLVGDPLPRDLLMTARARLRVTGTVQGVGFRPFVYRHARALGLAGFVRNDPGGVLIEVEGPAEHIDRLARVLVDEPPPLASVAAVTTETMPPSGGASGFRIERSEGAGTPTAPVGVDSATCAACLAEVMDPTDRRHRYPFTNCTSCGPRYSIVTGVPYDRPLTTMAGFTMCGACRREYDDPADRRFHAQPNACPDCGPHVTWRSPSGDARAERADALAAVAAALRSGAVVAVKGIGGYHLVVDAADRDAVAELRRRKARDDKPFAVMVPDLATAEQLAFVGDGAASALTSVARPVVLCPRRADAGVAPGVAPGLPDLGLMLAYSPLHHLLLADAARPLVVTSGNLSDEPIAHDDDDAVARLGPLVDGLLTHDRPIHIRCDDSVVRAGGRRVQALRRSRGMAPQPLDLPGGSHRTVLAVGAELKSTVAVVHDGVVVASHHLGDLEHLATYRSFRQAIDHLVGLYDLTPEVVAHDLHPEYLSTKFAQELDLPLVAVQHHHADVAACMVDHGRTRPVLGLAFDGLGFGTDGALWGGEALVAGFHASERVGHLRPVVMPGGIAAIREPWRMAVAWAAAAGVSVPLAEPDQGAVAALVEAGQGPVTTSVGRLLDGLAAWVTGRHRVRHEAQAVIELEALARGAARPGWSGLVTVEHEGDLRILDPTALVDAVARARSAGSDPGTIAAGIHEAVADGATRLAVELAGAHGLDTVALTGGVFQNVLLSDLVEDALSAHGLEVLVHERVPPNDGGISIGQAAIAATRAEPRAEIGAPGSA